MTVPILSGRGLVQAFADRNASGWRRRRLRAVDGVDLDVHEGETLAVVGESGSGKSSLARLLLALRRPTEGSILYRGTPLASLSRAERRSYRREVQAVFQDPASSLNPRRRVQQILADVTLEHGIATKAIAAASVAGQLEAVGLTPAAQFMPRYPHQLSGGQQQRVAIARAMALQPRLIVADEPLSSLDISIQTQLLELLAKLKRETRLGIVLISHDLGAVQAIADRVAVMYRGRVVESGRHVLERPMHPYTKALIDAKLIADPRAARARRRVVLASEAPPPDGDAAGCAFRNRCPAVQAVCHSVTPALLPSDNDRSLVACHLARS